MRLSILLMLLSQTFLTGCVGFAVSVPGSIQVSQVPNDGSDFGNQDYLPREIGSQEEVKRDPDKNEISYETGWQHGCLTFLIFLPANHGDCRRIEKWNYADSNQITIETHSHRLFGLWCSPIPYLAAIPLFDMGPAYYTTPKYFPFCEVHFGTELYKTGYTF